MATPLGSIDQMDSVALFLVTSLSDDVMFAYGMLNPLIHLVANRQLRDPSTLRPGEGPSSRLPLSAPTTGNFGVLLPRITIRCLHDTCMMQLNVLIEMML